MPRIGALLAPLAIALTLLTVACTPQRAAITAKPALWRVGDGDTTIWLFGSIHALPPGVAWETPMIERAIAEADTLILEVSPAAPDVARAEFLAVAKQDGLPPILERVTAADRGVLSRAMAVAEQSPETLDGLKSWAAALTVSAGASRAEDASAADGVEPVLTARFNGKAIGALETRPGQFSAFDRLPEPSQRFLLTQAARDALGARGNYDALLKAWAAGDEAGLAATIAPLAGDPAIAAALMTQRNARWTSAIVRRMARPGRVFVAVGAGHLVGPGSVVAMLRAQGLRVQRVE